MQDKTKTMDIKERIKVALGLDTEAQETKQTN